MLKDGKVRFLAPKEKVEPENIEDMYGVKVLISKVNGHQVVIPIEEN
jgi:ABC-type cobalamin/Fe3+-siderophores transport system ATPase subunit